MGEARHTPDIVPNGCAECERLKAINADLLAACEAAVAVTSHPENCGWWDRRYPNALMHEDGTCDCWQARARAAIAKATNGDRP